MAPTAELIGLHRSQLQALLDEVALLIQERDESQGELNATQQALDRSTQAMLGLAQRLLTLTDRP